jgi:hypothetical protein
LNALLEYALNDGLQAWVDLFLGVWWILTPEVDVPVDRFRWKKVCQKKSRGEVGGCEYVRTDDGLDVFLRAVRPCLRLERATSAEGEGECLVVLSEEIVYLAGEESRPVTSVPGELVALVEGLSVCVSG